MPIEPVDIAYNEPEPGAPRVPFADPELKEYTTLDSDKMIMMIIFNTRTEDMTLADVRQYERWIVRVPAMMRACMYHPDFINAVCELARNLAETIKTRLYMACPQSPDFHE